MTILVIWDSKSWHSDKEFMKNAVVWSQKMEFEVQKVGLNTQESLLKVFPS